MVDKRHCLKKSVTINRIPIIRERSAIPIIISATNTTEKKTLNTIN